MKRSQIAASVIGVVLGASVVLAIPAIAANNNGNNGNGQCGGNNGQGQGNYCPTPTPTPTPTVSPTVPPVPPVPPVTILSVGPNGDWLQQYGRQQTDNCPVTWGKSWAFWPNNYTGGFVCTRTIPAYGK
jgi:hypothetical protein